MKVRATDIKNNLGKYLKLCKEEDIYITKNDKIIAKLSRYESNSAGGNNTDIETGGHLILKDESGAYAYTGMKVNYEQFLSISDGNEERYEYLDGEVTLLSSPGIKHQLVQSNLMKYLLNWFDGKKCRVFSSPFDVTLENQQTHGKNVVQPDITISCDHEKQHNDRDRYTGIPAMVVEILSPDTKSRDHIRKLNLYMAGGVGEYWIVDPVEEKVLIYCFKERQLDVMHACKAPDTVKSIHFTGIEIPVADIFR